MIASLLLRFWPYIAIATLSACLYWQIGQTAKQKEYNQTLIGANQTQSEAIKQLQADSQLSEVIVVNNAGKREVIRDEVETIKYRVREVIRQAPAGDCLTAPHSVDVSSLLNASGEN